MRSVLIAAALVMCITLAQGCKDKETKVTAPKPAPGTTQPAARTPAPPAMDMPKAAVNASTTEAESMLKKVMDYIKERKLSDAEPLLKKLEEMKASLPQGLQDQIASARKAFDSAKAVPSVPGL
jgi:hypothetical protein